MKLIYIPHQLDKNQVQSGRRSDFYLIYIPHQLDKNKGRQAQKVLKV